MSHPRIEEVSDSDPSEGDISDFDESDILLATSSRPTKPATSTDIPHLAQQFRPPSDAPAPRIPGGPQTHYTSASDAKKYADFSVLYPLYFSSLHTRAEGRRVPSSLAVPNPLARDIAHACSQLSLQVLFEPGKSHPRDWSNPGRVRVRLPRDGEHPVKNKHHLFRVVADWLKRHPATEDSASLRFEIPGVPMPKVGEAWPRPAVPKGWKMPELLPFVSPAMSGGGVSEDLFKDMMREMAGGGDPMSALMGGGKAGGDEPPKRKKDKKGKGKV